MPDRDYRQHPGGTGDRPCEIVNNEQGDPILISGYNGNGKLYGREVATYDYAANRVTSTFFNAELQPVHKETRKISLRTKEKNARYNAWGELVYKQNDGGSHTEYQYKYDQFGNPTEEKIFNVVTRKNGKTKRDVERIYRYKYDYE